MSTPALVPTVLLVDDDFDTRELYEMALLRAGFDVRQAADGAEALELAASAKPDIIITDVVLPVIDGLELCRRLRSDKRTEGTPIIALTGYSSAIEEITGAKAAGANLVLLKPCLPDTLIEKIHTLVPPPAPVAHN